MFRVTSSVYAPNSDAAKAHHRPLQFLDAKQPVCYHDNRCVLDRQPTAESFASFPAACIETAEFDCLWDDGILYVKRLRQFGVPVELNNTEGAMHGFDVVLDSPIVRACVDRRITFLKQVFSAPALF